MLTKPCRDIWRIAFSLCVNFESKWMCFSRNNWKVYFECAVTYGVCRQNVTCRDILFKLAKFWKCSVLISTKYIKKILSSNWVSSRLYYNIWRAKIYWSWCEPFTIEKVSNSWCVIVRNFPLALSAQKFGATLNKEIPVFLIWSDVHRHTVPSE